MIRCRPNNYVYSIVSLLSVASEFSPSLLPLLGNKRTLENLVYKLTDVNEIFDNSNNSVYQSKVLTTGGKGETKTIRLFKKALPLLNSIHVDALESYLEFFNGHRFAGDRMHILRNHRVAEALALFMAAGIECRPYVLPKLQLDSHLLTVSDEPSFYVSRYLKRLKLEEFNKVTYTRMVGAVFYPGGCYAVYNSRDAEMKWSGTGELRTRLSLDGIARMNAGMTEVESALLLSSDEHTALAMVIDSRNNMLKDISMDKIFPYVHFVPLDDNGKRLIRILTLPDCKEQILSAVFSPETRTEGIGTIEYDAFIDGEYVYSHLDSDLNRLIRLKHALATHRGQVVVVCFPWQVKFLKDYLGEKVSLRELDIGLLEKALDLDP